MIHHYVLLLLTVALAITLLVLMHQPPGAPLDEIFCAAAFGWALGQLFRWEPPR